MSATPVDDLHFPISVGWAMLAMLGVAMLGVVVGKTIMFYAGCLLLWSISERTLSFPGVRT